ncbi:MAG: M4 family metallopeptidase [Deltaproteobacteria bacterium]|nr:M4 family metallopeptidase [Deltaproteobacteria bacterium]
MTRPVTPMRTLSLLIATAACSPSEDMGEPLPQREESVLTPGAVDPGTVARLAVAHFDAHRAEGLAPGTTFGVRRVVTDGQGRAHVRLQQRHGAVAVLGGEAIVHLAADGSFRRVTDDLVRDLNVDTTAEVTPAAAIATATAAVGEPDSDAPPIPPQLLIVRHEGSDHLVYRVRLRRLSDADRPAIFVVFIDAHTGDEVFRYDDRQPVALIDDDAATFDTQGGIDYFGAVIADSSDPVANDAHVHVGHSLEYFAATFGRDSFDGAGARVDAYVHFAVDFVDAFWDGQRLTFGDGDGVIAGPLTVLDVVAHEFTHGVTTYSAGLLYLNESGALNEATSDIFAAAVEAFVNEAVDVDTWRVGEDAWTPGVEGDALRYMHSPTLDGWSRDHYSTRYVGPVDNGGVHWNSGIANLFFFLLAQGGQHPNPAHQTGVVTGIGLQPAAQIWYAALVNEMTPQTTFAEARVATLAACVDLYGAGAVPCTSVGQAWCEVGVGGDACLAVGSCGEQCGVQSADGCFCDPLCVQWGDCCPDYEQLCLAGTPSCVGFCGEQSPGDCWCEPSCQQFGDCCPDFAEACG